MYDDLPYYEILYNYYNKRYNLTHDKHKDSKVKTLAMYEQFKKTSYELS